MSKVIQLQLQGITLNNSQLQDILDESPKDATFSFHEFTTGNLTIRIYSDKFKMVKETEVIPLATLSTKYNKFYSPYYDIQWPYDWKEEPLYNYQWFTNLNGSYKINTQITFSKVNIMINYQKEINKLNEKITEAQKELSIPKILINQCIHEWKHYEGLTKSYEYCVKCDEKLV
jgi:hypothetical protein